MLRKTGVALRARCCWLRVFGVSARCGMRKPNTRASIKPSPDHHVQTEAFGACDGSSARSLAIALSARSRGSLPDLQRGFDLLTRWETFQEMFDRPRHKPVH